MARKYFKSIFTGFLAGSIIAMILNQWIFLEMRVNINLVIPLFIFIGIAFYRFTRIRFNPKIIFFLQLIFGFLVCLLYNFSTESFFVIPASMFREAFFLNSLSLGEVNVFISILLIISNLIIFGKLKKFSIRYGEDTEKSEVIEF